MRELQHALSVRPGDTEVVDEFDLYEEDVLWAVCAGLIIIEETSRMIRLVHYTT